MVVVSSSSRSLPSTLQSEHTGDYMQIVIETTVGRLQLDEAKRDLFVRPVQPPAHQHRGDELAGPAVTIVRRRTRSLDPLQLTDVN